jgi:hypothetical protein
MSSTLPIFRAERRRLLIYTCLRSPQASGQVRG